MWVWVDDDGDGDERDLGRALRERVERNEISAFGRLLGVWRFHIAEFEGPAFCYLLYIGRIAVGAICIEGHYCERLMPA